MLEYHKVSFLCRNGSVLLGVFITRTLQYRYCTGTYHTCQLSVLQHICECPHKSANRKWQTLAVWTTQFWNNEHVQPLKGIIKTVLLFCFANLFICKSVFIVHRLKTPASQCPENFSIYIPLYSHHTNYHCKDVFLLFAWMCVPMFIIVSECMWRNHVEHIVATVSGGGPTGVNRKESYTHTNTHTHTSTQAAPEPKRQQP